MRLKRDYVFSRITNSQVNWGCLLWWQIFVMDPINDTEYKDERHERIRADFFGLCLASLIDQQFIFSFLLRHPKIALWIQLIIGQLQLLKKWSCFEGSRLHLLQRECYGNRGLTCVAHCLPYLMPRTKTSTNVQRLFAKWRDLAFSSPDGPVLYSVYNLSLVNIRWFEHPINSCLAQRQSSVFYKIELEARKQTFSKVDLWPFKTI